jgi:hypothetical protein
MNRRSCFAICGLICIAGNAEAGMPSVGYTISEAAKMRVGTLSFFLGGFFLSAYCIMWLWNTLANDFTIMPRLSYGKALALTTLWGLLFVLVLTMISGARELMTPGAWEKDGVTHKLRQQPVSSGDSP